MTRGSKRGLIITLVVLAVSMAVSVFLGQKRAREWDEEWRKVGPIPATGGLFFNPRREIKVPHFRQFDEKWGMDKLGTTEGTLAAEGCAVASAAMVLASYGHDTDPARLNQFLTENDGYEGAGWIKWESAAEISGGTVEKAYEDAPSFWHIDQNLLRGNPVIARLRAPDGRTHFVVVCGKEGYDYLACDPGTSRGVYPLKEYGSNIEALRFYRRK